MECDIARGLRVEREPYTRSRDGWSRRMNVTAGSRKGNFVSRPERFGIRTCIESRKYIVIGKDDERFQKSKCMLAEASI